MFVMQSGYLSEAENESVTSGIVHPSYVTNNLNGVYKLMNAS